MKKLSLPNKLFRLLLATLVMTIEVGCDEKATPSANSTLDIATPLPTTPIPTPSLADAVKLYDHMEKIDGRFHIYGLVENLNRSTIQTLILEFNFYDQYGTQVSEATTTISNLEAGGRANLSAYSRGQANQIVRYKLVKKTVF